MSASAQPFLYGQRLPSEQWVAAVDRLNRRGALHFIYAEEPANIYLDSYRQPDPHWTHGRAFGPNLEVRWTRRRDGQVDLALLTESPLSEREQNKTGWQPIPLLAHLSTDPPASLDAQVDDGWVMQLGVSRRHEKSPHGRDPNAPNEWTDNRVPRPIVYPLDAGDPPRRWVRLQVKTYRANGCPLLTRMVGMEVTNHVKKL